MATLLGYEILDMTVLNVDLAGRQARHILEAEFGDDVRATANVGNVGGVRSGHVFSLSAGVWPDDEEISTVDGVSAMEYYWEFFNDRIDAGNEPFIIEWRDAYWLVDLAEPNVGVDVHTSDLFTPQGISVRRRAVPGVVFNVDGSLYVDEEPPTMPAGFAVIDEGAGFVEVEWEASSD